MAPPNYAIRHHCPPPLKMNQVQNYIQLVVSNSEVCKCHSTNDPRNCLLGNHENLATWTDLPHAIHVCAKMLYMQSYLPICSDFFSNTIWLAWTDPGFRTPFVSTNFAQPNTISSQGSKLTTLTYHLNLQCTYSMCIIAFEIHEINF